MRHGAGAPPPGPRRRVPDPHPQEVAYLQMQARGWLVMWSPWRRTWTATALFGTQPIIIDHRNVHRLLPQCEQAETAAAHGPPTRA